MGNPSDFYEVLNLSKDSSPQEIRKAYKLLAKKWHPDKHPITSKAEAEARFKVISQAYEALSDQEVKATGGVLGDLKKTCSSVGAAVKRKPLPVERKLECTLEELFWGCKKEVTFTRDVVTKNGWVIQKQECHIIVVKPGWKKGTRIVFESMGDESPGWLPADVVFLISEKHHPYFKRIGNDLVLKVKVPLVNALTGWSFSFRLFGGEKLSCFVRDEIISPGHEKVIKGQGMPLANCNGGRGDLIIKFHVVFPEKLSKEQRLSVSELLKDGN